MTKQSILALLAAATVLLFSAASFAQDGTAEGSGEVPIPDDALVGPELDPSPLTDTDSSPETSTEADPAPSGEDGDDGEPETDEEAPETTPVQSTGADGDSDEPSPTNLPHLDEYSGVRADHANFDRTNVAARVELGPHSMLSLSFSVNYLAEEYYNVYAEVGIGMLSTVGGIEEELTYGPSWHLSLFQGYPILSRRSSHEGRWVIGRELVHDGEGGLEVTQDFYTVTYPRYHRWIVEAGIHSGVVNFDVEDRATAVGLGFRVIGDWDVDVRVYEEGATTPRETNLFGQWHLALHLVPVSFSGDVGTESGWGLAADTAFPVQRDRRNPMMTTMGVWVLPNGAISARLGLQFNLLRI